MLFEATKTFNFVSLEILYLGIGESAENTVVSIEFSPLSTVELTTNWYQLNNGDYEGKLRIRTQLW